MKKNIIIPRRVWVTLVVLLILVASFIWAIFSPQGSPLQDGLINLLTGIICVVISLLFVESALRRAERDKEEYYIKIAVKKLLIPLKWQINLMVKAFKASTNRTPSITDKVELIISDDFLKTLYFLDLSKQGPTASGENWLFYFSRECRRFEEYLSHFMTQYAIFLPPTIIEVIESVLNSNYIKTFTGKLNVWVRQGGSWVELPNYIDFIEGEKYQYDLSLFQHELVQKALKEYIDIVYCLFNYCMDNISDKEKYGLDKVSWDSDPAPTLGSARTSEAS